MTEHAATGDFRHEALLYRGESDFVERVAPFILDGIATGEPTLVMVSSAKINALRERMGGLDGLVEYRDMQTVGANPARIIPAWDEFAVTKAQDGAVRLRGVGEPIWHGRLAGQMEECHWHESLINRAFADVKGFWLICPYDAAALDPSVVDEARTTHPVIIDGDRVVRTAQDVQDAFPVPTTPLAAQLAQPDRVVAEMSFAADTLMELRAIVAVEGARAGLSPERLEDLILAVSEIATNSVTHGGGRGVARVWLDGGDVVCEISDRGVITDPLVDRHRPGHDPSSARGLWTANQLCDLVQVRSSRERGSVVRLLVHAGHRTA